MRKRIALIDVAKGISIILVAFHHSKLTIYWSEISNAMGLFRMPLFFFLSGVFFNPLIDRKKFILKKADALLKPYFFTLLILFFTSLLFDGSGDFGDILGIFYGNGPTIEWVPLWFLTHLWSIFVISYLLVNYTKLKETKDDYVRIVVIFVLLFLGSYLVNKFWQIPVSVWGISFSLPGLPFSIDFVLLSMAFFLSGYYLSKKVQNFTPNVALIPIVIVIYLLILMYTEAQINLNSRVYNKPFFATLAAFSGIYFVLSASYYLCRKDILVRIFSAFGGASLFILIFHSFICGKIYWLLFYEYEINYQFICAVISFIGCIIIPVFMKDIIWKISFLRMFYFPLNRY